MSYDAWKHELAEESRERCPACSGGGYHTDGITTEECRTCEGTGWATAEARRDWERLLDAAERE